MEAFAILSVIRETSLPKAPWRRFDPRAGWFGWKIPQEWNMGGAVLLGSEGGKTVHFKQDNLYVIGHRFQLDVKLTLDQPQEHLHTVSGLYTSSHVTSYSEPSWGFCHPHCVTGQLQAVRYEAVIQSLIDGALAYASDGSSEQRSDRSLLPTCGCHSSMASNEPSGLWALSAVVRWVSSLPVPPYIDRLVRAPETPIAIVGGRLRGSWE